MNEKSSFFQQRLKNFPLLPKATQIARRLRTLRFVSYINPEDLGAQP